MLKVYVLNHNINNSTFTIFTEAGNGVTYTFKGGNVLLNQRPTCMIQDPYFQKVIEDSDLFKSGLITFDATTKKAIVQERMKEAEKALEAEPQVDDFEQVKDIVSVTEAINYVAERWGEIAKNARQAKDIAMRHGVDFVYLKVKD